MKKPNRSRTAARIMRRHQADSIATLNANLRRLGDLLPSANEAAAGLRVLGQAFAKLRGTFPQVPACDMAKTTKEAP